MSSRVRNQSDVVAMYNRISIAFLITVAIALACAVYLSYESQKALSERYDLTVNAIRFVGGSTFMTSEVRAYAADGHEVHYTNYWRERNEDKNREIGMANLRAIGVTPEEDAIIAKMISISTAIAPYEERAIDFVRKSGDHPSAVNEVFGTEYAAQVNEIGDLNNKFRALLDARLQSKVDLYVMLSQTFNAIVAVLTLCIIILQVKNMRYVRNALIKPIQVLQSEMIHISQGNLRPNESLVIDESEIGQLTNSVRVTKNELKKYIGDISTKLSNMSNGNLNMDIDIDYIGDFKPIKESLQEILKSFNYTIARMSNSVDDVSSAIISRTGKVVQGSEDMARNAEDEAQRIANLSATVRDLSGEMAQIADSATRSHKSTAAAAMNLEKSSERMNDMQSAMEDINTASEGIKKITDTIANIGARTNIVAINAAIEAAKAGDVGRGFAVVADEVRKLAIMCSDASRETDKLLESTVRSVERGIELTNDMTEAMRELIDVSRSSAESVEEIAAQSERQADSLKDMVDGFEYITGTVQHNASTARESAAAAEEMNAQADKLTSLRSLFDDFTLRPNGSIRR